MELCLTPEGRWVIDDLGRYLDDVTAAKFGLVGLSAGLAAPLPRPGVGCAELMALQVRRDEEATLASAAALAAAAEQVGATWVLSMMYTRVREESIDLLGRCADLIVRSGARVAIEFGPVPPMSTIPEAVALSEAVGRGTGVLIDTWHFFHGGSTFEDLEAMPLDQLAYIQFDDAPPLESDDLMHETVNRRVMPGDGHLDLDRFARTLRDRGWDGVVSVEVLSDDLCKLPVAEFARRAYETTAPYWL